MLCLLENINFTSIPENNISFYLFQCGEQKQFASLSSSIHFFSCELQKINPRDESIQIVQWFRSMIFKCLPDGQYDNCRLLMTVNEYNQQLDVKIGNGNTCVTIAIDNYDVHITSPQIEFVEHSEFAEKLADLIYELRQSSAVERFLMWMYSRNYDVVVT